MTIRLGIDLGTTYSCMAYLKNGKEPTVLQNKEGELTTPSVVGFSDGECLVGSFAKSQLSVDPENTCSLIKRKMGTEDIINLNNTNYRPEQISALILTYLRDSAREYFGEEEVEAVITVPAYFNSAERQATKDAGKIAGLKVLNIISEPTAAAIEYGFDKKDEQTILVYDLGGGTFDVSILHCDGKNKFTVLAVNGDKHLGGSDFDYYIVEKALDEFREAEGIDLSTDPAAVARLTLEAEQWKKKLSGVKQVKASIANISGAKHLKMVLTRDWFEERIKDRIDTTLEIVDKALEDAAKNDLAKEHPEYSKPNALVLVGGSTRIPYVAQKLEEKYSLEVNRDIHPDLCVALGAAIAADAAPKEDSVPNPNPNIDPRLIEFTDVTSHGLGIKLAGDKIDILIKAQSNLPAEKKKIYTTHMDNQTKIKIPIIEGENPPSFLADLELIIDPAPRGVPRVEVTYSIDKEGMVHVSAVEKISGKSAEISPNRAVNLSAEALEEMTSRNEETDMVTD